MGGSSFGNPILVRLKGRPQGNRVARVCQEPPVDARIAAPSSESESTASIKLVADLHYILCDGEFLSFFFFFWWGGGGCQGGWVFFQIGAWLGWGN